MKFTVAWRTIGCPSCGGHGLKASEWSGAAECSDCGGGGFFFVTPSDRLADYPGGPFRGSWPGAYAEATPWEPPVFEEVPS